MRKDDISHSLAVAKVFAAMINDPDLSPEQARFIYRSFSQSLDSIMEAEDQLFELDDMI